MSIIAAATIQFIEESVNPGVGVAGVVLVASSATFGWRRWWRRPSISGRDGLIGRRAVVRYADGHTGRVVINGTWWNAHSGEQPLRAGQTVRILGMVGLQLIVRPEHPASDLPAARRPGLPARRGR